MSKVEKKDGTLKKKYHDLPRYPVIYKYEDQFKLGFSIVLGQMVKEIGSTLNEMKKNG